MRNYFSWKNILKNAFPKIVVYHHINSLTNKLHGDFCVHVSMEKKYFIHKKQ